MHQAEGVITAILKCGYDQKDGTRGNLPLSAIEQGCLRMFFNRKPKAREQTDARGKLRDALNRAIVDAYGANLSYRDVAKELETRAEVARALGAHRQNSAPKSASLRSTVALSGAATAPSVK